MPKFVNIAKNGHNKWLINLDNVTDVISITVEEGHVRHEPEFAGCKVGDSVTSIVFCAAASIGDSGDLQVGAMTSLAKLPIDEFIRRCREEVLVV